MTEPHVEHLTIRSDHPAAPQAAGFWPPLPIGLWLPPATALLVALALTTALCLSGPQSVPDAPAGWLEPHNAPALIAWIAALTAVFIAPQLCAPQADQPHPGWKRLLQAAAVGLPIAAIAWAFYSIGLLLGGQVTAPTAQPIQAAAPAAVLPPGLLFALMLGLIAGVVWVNARSRPMFSVVVLAGWSALPPLTWFLCVDILGREATPLPAGLTLNPVFLPVLLARQPQDVPGWALLALPAMLIAWSATLAGWDRLRRRSAVAPSPPAL